MDNKDFVTLLDDFLRQGRDVSFIARGASMSPFIIDGDTVTVRHEAAPPGRGDVVLLRDKSGRAVVHRVRSKTPGGIVTRGDACRQDDGETAPEDVLGRVIGVSGRGYSFHLWHPFSVLIALGISPGRLHRFPRILKASKALGRLFGLFQG